MSNERVEANQRQLLPVRGSPPPVYVWAPMNTIMPHLLNDTLG